MFKSSNQRRPRRRDTRQRLPVQNRAQQQKKKHQQKNNQSKPPGQAHAHQSQPAAASDTLPQPSPAVHNLINSAKYRLIFAFPSLYANKIITKKKHYKTHIHTHEKTQKSCIRLQTRQKKTQNTKQTKKPHIWSPKWSNHGHNPPQYDNSLYLYVKPRSYTHAPPPSLGLLSTLKQKRLTPFAPTVAGSSNRPSFISNSAIPRRWRPVDPGRRAICPRRRGAVGRGRRAKSSHASRRSAQACIRGQYPGVEVRVRGKMTDHSSRLVSYNGGNIW